MASAFGNVASFLGNKKKKEGEESELLAMWSKGDTDTKDSAMCLKWAPDDAFIAAGYSDGGVRLFSTEGKLSAKVGMAPAGTGGGLMSELVDGKMPCMSLCFKPKETTKVVLRTACADGQIEQFNVKGGKSGQSIATFTEKHTESGKANSILAMDYGPEGDKYVTGGVDRIVRVYDETSKVASRELKGSLAGQGGHSNRICAVRCNVSRNGMVASASLDGTVMLWDWRTSSEEPFATFSGLACAGDSIDMRDMYLLVGSWRPAQQLQIFDIRKKELIHDVAWKRKKVMTASDGKKATAWAAVRESVRGSTNVYAAQYVGDGCAPGTIVAGGTGSREVKVFTPLAPDRLFAADKPFEGPYQPIASMVVPSGVHGLHVSRDGKNIAVAAQSGLVYKVQMPSPEPVVV